MCVRGGEETDRVSRGWLLSLHQATDCIGRGEPMQAWSQFSEHTRPTLRRLETSLLPSFAHGRTDGRAGLARGNASERLAQGRYAAVFMMLRQRFHLGSSDHESNALTTRPPHLMRF